MRAIFYPEQIQDQIIIEDDQVHHLKNVLRVKEEEEVLVLNGRGLTARARVQTIKKKTIELEILSRETEAKETGIELAIGLPKKELFEDICRMAIELGIKKIYAVKCEYSQWKYQTSERLEKIMISACLQSNNPWLPEIESIESVENLLKLKKKIIPMDIIMGKTPQNIIVDETVLLVGPEAGFSEEERASFEGLEIISLRGPILRATTAVPTGIGLLLGYTL